MQENLINVVYFEDIDNLEFFPSSHLKNSETALNNTSCDLLLDISEQILIDYFSEDESFVKLIHFDTQYAINEGSIIYSKFAKDWHEEEWILKISYLDNITADEISIFSKTETFDKKLKTQYSIMKELVNFLQTYGALKDSYSFTSR